MFWEEPKLRKVVGLAWDLHVCSELTDTETLTRTFLGENLLTVILQTGTDRLSDLRQNPIFYVLNKHRLDRLQATVIHYI